jgi:hypothetical protein
MVELFDEEGNKILDTEIESEISKKKKAKRKISNEIKKLSKKSHAKMDFNDLERVKSQVKNIVTDGK